MTREAAEHPQVRAVPTAGLPPPSGQQWRVAKAWAMGLVMAIRCEFCPMCWAVRKTALLGANERLTVVNSPTGSQ